MVERGGLENRCTSNSTVGSNPTLSAIFPEKHEFKQNCQISVRNGKLGILSITIILETHENQISPFRYLLSCIRQPRSLLRDSN